MTNRLVSEFDGGTRCGRTVAPLLRHAYAKALLGAFSALLIAGCGGGTSEPAPQATAQPQLAGSIVVAVGSPFASWDATASFDGSQDARLGNLVAETLVQQSRDGGIEPGIATRWEFSNGNRTVTFHLREGVTFSNGMPVTADDVAFSFKEGWMGKGNINGPTYLKYVVSAQPLDARTIAFTSEYPNGSIPYVLSYGLFGIYPKDWAGKTKQEFMKAPIGAGPFLAGPVKLGTGGWDEVIVTRNPGYYGAKARLDKITFRYLPDTNQQALQFRSGAIDLVRKVDVGLVDLYDPATIRYFPSADIYVILTSWNSKPWVNQVQFRRAISLAIDRKKLIEGYWRGHAKIATHVAPEELKDTPPPPNGDWTRYDPAEARRLLAEIGYRGEEITFDRVGTDQGQRVLSQVIAGMLGDVGINIKVLTSPDYNAYLNRLSGPDGQGGPYALASGGVPGVLPHPGEIMASYADWSWYSVGAPTQDAKRFRLEVIAGTTPAEARQAMEKVEQWAYDHAVMVPLVQLDLINAIQPWLKGYEQNLLGMWRPNEWYVTR